MWRWVLVLMVLLASAAGVIVGWLNPGEVTVDLLLASFVVPLGVLILGCIAFGAGAGLLMGIVLVAWSGRRGRNRGKIDAGRAKGISPSPAPHD